MSPTPMATAPKVALFGGTSAFGGGYVAELGGPRPRAILARLAWSCGEIVAIDDLVDGIWGEQPPPRVRAAIQVHVAALRRAFAALTGDQVIVTRSPGYRLDLPRPSIDVLDFASVAASLRTRRPELSSDLLDHARRALMLWRGAPFAGLDGTPFIEPIVPWLEERRSELIEAVAAIADRPADATNFLPIVEQVASSRPLDEPLWVAWARLLSTAGRRRDALCRLADLRCRLWDDAGLRTDAGVDLLERQLLHDELERGGSVVVDPRPPRVSRRDADRDIITRTLEASDFVTVCGPIGVGTGALVRDTAALARARGQAVQLIDLSDDAAQEHQLSIDGPNADLIVVVAEADVTAARDLVRLVRAGQRGCLLVASTAPLDLPGERIVRVDPLPAADALELLRGAIADHRGRARSTDEHQMLREILDACDGLDVAISFAAMRLRHQRADHTASEIRRSAEYIGGSIERALERLTRLARQIVLSASLLDGWFDDEDVWRALPRPRPRRSDVCTAIGELAHAGLVCFDPTRTEPYHVPRPIALAIHECSGDDGANAARQLLARSMTARVRWAAAAIGTDAERGEVAWIHRHQAALEALARHPATLPAHRRTIARSLLHTLLASGDVDTARELLSSTVAVGELRRRDLAAVAKMALAVDEYDIVDECVERIASRDRTGFVELAFLHVRSLRHRCAFESAHARLDELSTIVDPASTQGASLDLESGMLLAMEARTDLARERLRRARESFDRCGIRRAVGACWVYEAWCDLADGRERLAVPALERSLAVADDLGHRADAAFTHTLMAHVCLARGEHRDALALADSALDHFRPRNDRLGMARALEVMAAAESRSRRDRPAAAEAEWLRAQIRSPISPLESAILTRAIER